MSRKHLFHIYNKQQLLCTSGNFHVIRSCQRKDMKRGVQFGSRHYYFFDFYAQRYFWVMWSVARFLRHIWASCHYCWEKLAVTLRRLILSRRGAFDHDRTCANDTWDVINQSSLCTCKYRCRCVKSQLIVKVHATVST